MPYIVTVSQESPDSDENTLVMDELSRTAVATLDEARAVVNSALPAERICHELPTDGGTIELPDGTVIEVQRVSWHTLEHHAGLPYPNGETPASILAAFNAR